MADKPQTLEDLARIEAAALKKRDQARLDYIEGQKRLITELPQRFFLLAQQVREGVKRFNNAAPIERPVSYIESPAVTTKDASNMAGDFWFEVKRKPNELLVALRSMTRAGKPDSYIIEGQGTVGLAPMNDRFALRVDALIVGKEIKYKTVCARYKLDSDIDELGDRLVMVIVTSQITRLWNNAPWAGDSMPQSDRR
jgi:hypothetical protein